MLLSAKKLSISANGRKYFESIDFDIREGERIQLVVSQGYGLSLFLKSLVGLAEEIEVSGELSFHSRDLTSLSFRKIREAGLLFLPESSSSFESLSAQEFLELLLNRRLASSELVSLEKKLRRGFQWETRLGELSLTARRLLSLLPIFLGNWKLVILDRSLGELPVSEQSWFFDCIEREASETAFVLPLPIGDFPRFRPSQIWHLQLPQLLVERVQTEEETLSFRLRALEAQAARKFPPKNPSAVQKESVQDFSFSDSSLSLYRGEILGLFSKRARAYLQRHLKISDQSVSYVSGFRSSQGVWPSQSMRFNLCFASEYRRGNFWIRERDEELLFDHYCRVLHIPKFQASDRLETLSIDVQQKVLLGRALSLRPKLLVAEEASRGTTDATKEEIYHIVRQLSDFGVSVIWLSQDLLELEKLCHRVLVLSETGKEARLLEADEVDARRILEGAQSVYGSH